MALLSEDRDKLAKLLHNLSKRVADKERRKQLVSIDNKLRNRNPLSPTDMEILQAVVHGLLSTPVPKVASGATALDYALVIPAVRKHLFARRIRKQSANLRTEFREILERL